MKWHEHVTWEGYKLLYKGVDIGFTAELIQDIMANTGMEIDDKIVESMYNQNIIIIREKKIDEILS